MSNKYQELYNAYSKRYVFVWSKQQIQKKCNAFWADLKTQYSGEELNRVIDEKIAQLRVETKPRKTFTQSTLLGYCNQVLEIHLNYNNNI